MCLELGAGLDGEKCFPLVSRLQVVVQGSAQVLCSAWLCRCRACWLSDALSSHDCTSVASLLGVRKVPGPQNSNCEVPSQTVLTNSSVRACWNYRCVKQAGNVELHAASHRLSRYEATEMRAMANKKPSETSTSTMPIARLVWPAFMAVDVRKRSGIMINRAS